MPVENPKIGDRVCVVDRRQITGTIVEVVTPTFVVVDFDPPVGQKVNVTTGRIAYYP